MTGILLPDLLGLIYEYASFPIIDVRIDIYENNIGEMNWLTGNENSCLPKSFWDKHKDHDSKLSVRNNITHSSHIQDLYNQCNSYTRIMDIYYKDHKKRHPDEPCISFLCAQRPRFRFDIISFEWLRKNINVDTDINTYLFISLSSNPTVPIEFFEKHLNKINWYAISSNTSIPMWFLEKYIDNIVWSGLSGNSSVPLSFFEKYFDKISWYGFSKNIGVPLHYMRKEFIRLLS